MIWFEIKKIFSKTGSKVGLFILLAVLLVSCYFAILSPGYVDEKGEVLSGIAVIKNAKTINDTKEEWSGLITEDYLKEVIRENNRIIQEYPYQPEDVETSNLGYAKKQGFSDIRDMINQAFSKFREYNYWAVDSVSEEEVGSFYANRVQNLKNWLDSEEAKEQFSDQEKAYLIQQYETLETPFYYEPADGYIAALEYAPTIIMMTLLVLSFFVAGIFSNEFQWKADAIFFSTKYGREKGTFAKIAAGLLVITVVYWSMILVYSAMVFGVLGTSGAHCMIQVGFGYWKSFYHITYLQAYLLTVLGGYVGNLFILLVSMLVSAKSHSTVLAVTIPFLIVFFESVLGDFKFVKNLLPLFPDRLLQMNMVLRLFDLYEIGGKVTGTVPILLIGYLALGVAVLPILYWIYRRTEIS